MLDESFGRQELYFLKKWESLYDRGVLDLVPAVFFSSALIYHFLFNDLFVLWMLILAGIYLFRSFSAVSCFVEIIRKIAGVNKAGRTGEESSGMVFFSLSEKKMVVGILHLKGVVWSGFRRFCFFCSVFWLTTARFYGSSEAVINFVVLLVSNLFFLTGCDTGFFSQKTFIRLLYLAAIGNPSLRDAIGPECSEPFLMPRLLTGAFFGMIFCGVIAFCCHRITGGRVF
ncbi:MAG: hypothetical protein PHQ23_17490 [Candidatus Wallbacteria bacterium]|nr:hypothetical protein [Candidatus Wallbacteria bacterium]